MASDELTQSSCAEQAPPGKENGSRSHHASMRMRFQIALIVAGFLAYMAVRAVASDVPEQAFGNAADVLAFERRIGIDWELGVQAIALDAPHVVSFFNAVYAWLYWPCIIGAFLFTWFRRRDLYLVYRNSMFISGGIGLTIFLFCPVAPPRFLDGFVDTVDAGQRSHFVAHPSFLINKFAALPSFHVGWVALACAVVAFSTRRRWLQALLAIPPVLMAGAVVVTGNHYVVDIVAGVGLAAIALAVSLRRSHARLVLGA